MKGKQQPTERALLSYIALLQGGYYVITGIWPLVHIRSFMAITGRKTDLWLVKTAGVLITTIDSTLGVAGLRGKTTPEISFLAIGSALGLTGIDIVYVAKKQISPIYLLDAVAELGVIGLWGISVRSKIAMGKEC
ncbi:MAG: hypothetical protein IVW55_04635 [Chloroflexi bacterium]|nr:hypothetical protein [Chloroflexota bacterium]